MSLNAIVSPVGNRRLAFTALPSVVRKISEKKEKIDRRMSAAEILFVVGVFTNNKKGNVSLLGGGCYLEIAMLRELRYSVRLTSGDSIARIVPV